MFSEESTGNIAKRRLLVNPYGPEMQTEFCWLSRGKPPDFRKRGFCESRENVGAEFGEGTATKQKSVKRSAFFTEWGRGIQWVKASVRKYTGKAIQWKGWGCSVNRRTLKIKCFCAHPLLKCRLLPSMSCAGWSMLWCAVGQEHQYESLMDVDVDPFHTTWKLRELYRKPEISPGQTGTETPKPAIRKEKIVRYQRRAWYV